MTRKDVLANKGRIYLFDEAATHKKFVEIGIVDKVEIHSPSNPVEIKTTSGISIYKNIDLDCSLSFDWYNPGDLKSIERMFRGATKLTTTTGSTVVAGEKQYVNFRKINEAAPLAGFNGAATPATVNSVKSADGVTTYTVSTDYTVVADSITGLTLIVHVSTGAIPLGTDILVNYDYTPLKANILKPDYGGTLVERFLVIDSYPDCTDPTKYRRYILPRMTVTSELMHSHVDIGKDNSTPNIMPVTFEFAKPDACDNNAVWAWYDTFNV